MAPLAFELPKYAQIVNAIQERITNGTYPLGSAIPSEAALGAEFGASRPVVVRALGILQQDGWVEAEQGRGRFVRRAQPLASRTGAGRSLLGRDEAVEVTMLGVGVINAPSRAALALGLPPASPVLARQRLVGSPIGPVELATSYLSIELAAGTQAGEALALSGGIIVHLQARKAVRFDHATQRIGARLATAAETRLLELPRREPVLTVLVTAYDPNGTALLATDAVIPATRRELEDHFRLS